MANWDAYRAMKAEAEAVGWPKHWQTDLTKHDRIRLSRADAPEEFIWVLRECGTQLLELGNAGELDWLFATFTLHGPRPNLAGKAAHWYVWRDGELEAIDPEDALELFCQRLVGRPVIRKERNIGTVAEIYRHTTTYGTKTHVKVDRYDAPAMSFLSDNVTIAAP